MHVTNIAMNLNSNFVLGLGSKKTLIHLCDSLTYFLLDFLNESIPPVSKIVHAYNSTVRITVHTNVGALLALSGSCSWATLETVPTFIFIILNAGVTFQHKTLLNRSMFNI